MIEIPNILLGTPETLPLPLTTDLETPPSQSKRPLVLKLRESWERGWEEVRPFTQKVKEVGDILLEPIRFSVKQFRENKLNGAVIAALILSAPVGGYFGVGALTENPMLKEILHVVGVIGAWYVIGNCLKEARSQADWHYPLS